MKLNKLLICISVLAALCSSACSYICNQADQDNAQTEPVVEPPAPELYKCSTNACKADNKTLLECKDGVFSERTCDNACYGGECLTENAPYITKCSDDTCKDDTLLKCDTETGYYLVEKCESGCENNACKVVEPTTPDEAPADTIPADDSEDDNIVDVSAATEKDSIDAVFKTYKYDVQNCYKLLVADRGKVEGKLSVRITIGTDGKVMMIQKDEDEVGGNMYNCLKQRIMNWEFESMTAPLQFKKTWVFK